MRRHRQIAISIFFAIALIPLWLIAQVGQGPFSGGISEAPDLSAYALLAGDADGQTIQGRTGANAARVDIGESVFDESVMYGGGANPASVSTTATTAQLTGAFGNVAVQATSVGLNVISSGALNIYYGQTPPTNANDACTAGDTIDTASFHYYCAATNTWVRVAMATWP